jgi:hypothetical protein
MRFWHVARWVLLVIWALALTMFVVRGPEDDWIRDSSGEWVAHGHPAGPPPAADYEPPFHERALPAVGLSVMVLAVVFAAFFGGRSPTSRDALQRSIRYFGTVSIIASALAVLLALALAVAMASALGDLETNPVAIMACLVGAIVLLKVLSWHADGAKRLLEAHYDLKRATALLQDAVERLAVDERKGAAPTG